MRQVTKDQWGDALGRMYRKIRIKVKNNASGLRYVGDKIISGQNQAIGQATEGVYVAVSNETVQIHNALTQRFQKIWNDLLDKAEAGN